MHKRRQWEATYLTTDVSVLTSGAAGDAPVRRDCRLLSVFSLSVFSGMEAQEESCSFAASSLPLAHSATVSTPLTIIPPLPPAHAAAPTPSFFPSSFNSSPFLTCSFLSFLSTYTTLKLKGDKRNQGFYHYFQLCCKVCCLGTEIASKTHRLRWVFCTPRLRKYNFWNSWGWF